jgi:hypothetical protein
MGNLKICPDKWNLCRGHGGCKPSSPDSADYGGACFLEVSHAELSRVCAARCSSTFGQFVYFAPNTQSRFAAVTLFHPANQGKAFGGVYFHRNKPPRVTGLNFTDVALAAHGAAISDSRSEDCECLYLTVCHCRGVTVAWSDSSLQISISNFFRNTESTVVISSTNAFSWEMPR